MSSSSLLDCSVESIVVWVVLEYVGTCSRGDCGGHGDVGVGEDEIAFVTLKSSDTHESKLGWYTKLSLAQRRRF